MSKVVGLFCEQGKQMSALSVGNSQNSYSNEVQKESSMIPAIITSALAGGGIALLGGAAGCDYFIKLGDSKSGGKKQSGDLSQLGKYHLDFGELGGELCEMAYSSAKNVAASKIVKNIIWACGLFGMFLGGMSMYFVKTTDKE